MKDDYAECLRQVKFASRPSVAKYEQGFVKERAFSAGRRFGKNISTRDFVKLLYSINYSSNILRETWKVYLLRFPEERI